MSDAATESAPAAQQPVLRIEGDATAEEVAAVVAVLQAVGAAQSASTSGTRARPSEWSAPHRRHRQPPRTGPGAWTTSALPR